MLVEAGLDGFAGTIAHSPRRSPTLERRRRWERRFRWCLRLSDAAVILVSVGLSLLLQRVLGEVQTTAWIASAMLVTLWYLLLAGVRSRESQCLGSGTAEYQRVVNATWLSFGITAICALAFNWSGERVLLFSALPGGVIGLLLSRWLWRRWLQRQRAAGHYALRTLVVGERLDVEYVIRTLRAGDQGFHVIGATLFGADRAPLTVGGRRYPVHGSIDQVAAVASRIGADTIVVASRPEHDPTFVRELSWKLEGTAANLVLSNQLTDVVGPRISFRPVEGLPMLQISIPSYEGGYHLLKRGLDICVAVLALAFIAVITPVLALAIKLDSPGAVFFAQWRVGRDGRLFKMYKFRTMVVEAEERLVSLLDRNEGAGVLFKMRNDPRVTRVGRVLRKISLDELPQFWNVLRGDMSVVGPRPPLPGEVTAYDGTVVRRLYVKPGITGPWQVSGRSDLSWDESVRLDLSYVENWSVMNDLQIMWRTARVMVQREGAY
ncbi:sugar transferase [Leucobacter sp. wl10]|uniref:sugar transferase n=1 Tax=Leucobacter sp. wl10 TaxID=2304677 RepID=UPI000E5A3597|nr:sugar transferase [Leucobacter sp. wl10]RGE19856.1 sugar transferase [Leucobacter sp. wl10]